MTRHHPRSGATISTRHGDLERLAILVVTRGSVQRGDICALQRQISRLVTIPSSSRFDAKVHTLRRYAELPRTDLYDEPVIGGRFDRSISSGQLMLSTDSIGFTTILFVQKAHWFQAEDPALHKSPPVPANVHGKHGSSQSFRATSRASTSTYLHPRAQEADQSLT